MRKSIAIIREKSPHEKRVVLCPDDLEIFARSSYDVYVETEAGAAIGISDSEYENAGAIIVGTQEAWTASNIVFKYKPPTRQEYEFLRPDMTIGAIFHAEGDIELIEALLSSGVTAYTYEFFKTDDGLYPMSIVGGEVAGKMAVIYAAYHLQAQLGGRGVLLSNILGNTPARCIVIGYGNVGSAAALQLANLGCDVLVLGRNPERLRRFQSVAGNKLRTAVCTPEVLTKVLPQADAVFGAILISTYNTAPIITEEMVKSMKPGSILVDITSGYGPGYIETFTQECSLTTPIFNRFGVLHCKIDNLPSAVPISTARSYSQVASPYLFALTESINGNNADPVSQSGMIVKSGGITHPVVKDHYEFYQRERSS